MELLSFIGLHIYLKRKFNLSAIYQLAFVLENQMAMVQSKLITWVIVILPFMLRHLGKLIQIGDNGSGRSLY
ncbi:TPA: hypothetical protein N0F65_001658 [Lagenidium giganteum]|uniref:Uncharacterized protein n=1 Tax=Lagenidium giganteum TaxID=4803 RepID=A0AAV2Z252_9STRA|nr:TPA: hypothetical protein N0F65_001658 [Lagenidium giganteum]